MTACTTYSGILCEDLQGVSRGGAHVGKKRRGRRNRRALVRCVARRQQEREADPARRARGKGGEAVAGVSRLLDGT